ncbi:methyltransferase domain-containing protein [Neisseria brasiliensis]|uniref:DNA methyltransferase n=1 Tax=Neisseria TaxID=482 RepID=UPI000C26E6BE|nr:MULTISPECIES: DNA methyltransferase [Neisseria]PJO78332.1 hypothetical protein CWC45_05810 [Neisseria sp. N177_16]QGL26482.1 methyltransferase domain-containing protein [Neisseria brasiliensis]
MIYIDPPYNTGSDSFVYPDKFAETREEYAKRVGDKDQDGYLLRDGAFAGAWRKNSKDNGHYHSNWLSMMLPRLHLAKTLLREDGVIFISIDDNEQAQLKLLCDEVFGAENFVSEIVWRRTDNQPNIGNLAKVKEYLLCYAKNIYELELGKLSLTDKALKEYRYSDENGLFRRKILLDKTRGRHFYDVKTKSGNILTGPWMIKKEDFEKLDAENGIYWTSGGDEQPYGKLYLDNSKGQIPNDFWGIEFGTNQRGSLEVEELLENRYFDFPKPTLLITNLLKLGSNSNDLILDFFSGYGWHCIYAMENGASSVVGVDISHKMLEVAKGKTHFPQIEYECCAIEDVDFPEESFDVILSSLAFHYVADYENLIKKIYRMLKAGGNLVFTVEHPVFTAHGTQDWYYNEKGEILHFPVDNYYYEGKRTAMFLEEKVTKYHRTLTTYLNTLLSNSFIINQIVEPQPPENMMDIPGMADEMRRPMMLIVSAKKKM